MALVACPDCGREVSSEAPSCPQCNRPSPGRAVPAPAPSYAAPGDPGYNGTAIWSFVLGLVGIVLCGFTALIALPLGIVSLNQLNAQLRSQKPEQKGRWMAVTGIVLGSVGILLLLVFLMWAAS